MASDDGARSEAIEPLRRPCSLLTRLTAHGGSRAVTIDGEETERVPDHDVSVSEYSAGSYSTSPRMMAARASR
jgi:hypothetical protein